MPPPVPRAMYLLAPAFRNTPPPHCQTAKRRSGPFSTVSHHHCRRPRCVSCAGGGELPITREVRDRPHPRDRNRASGNVEIRPRSAKWLRRSATGGLERRERGSYLSHDPRFGPGCVQRIERIRTPAYTCTLSGAASQARNRLPAANCQGDAPHRPRVS